MTKICYHFHDLTSRYHNCPSVLLVTPSCPGPQAAAPSPLSVLPSHSVYEQAAREMPSVVFEGISPSSNVLLTIQLCKRNKWKSELKVLQKGKGLGRMRHIFCSWSQSHSTNFSFTWYPLLAGWPVVWIQFANGLLHMNSAAGIEPQSPWSRVQRLNHSAIHSR